jgi:hypothetical protein
MARSKSMLVARKSEPKAVTFSFRISAELSARAAAVKELADKNGFDWQAGSALADELETLVSAAEKDLAKLSKPAGSVSGSTPPVG